MKQSKLIFISFIVLALLPIGCNKGKEKVVTTQLNTTFELNFNQTAEIINESLSVKFNQVNDGRCPTGSVCFWQGEGKVTLNVNSTQIVLSTLNNKVDTLGYLFTLQHLQPYPDIHKSIKDKDYVLTMIVSK